MKDISLFAVYDGHGGHEVAEWTGEHLPKTIVEKFKDINTDDVEQIKEALSSIFHAHGKFLEDIENDLDRPRMARNGQDRQRQPIA